MIARPAKSGPRSEARIRGQLEWTLLECFDGSKRLAYLLTVTKSLQKIWRVSLSGCMLSLADDWLRGGLSMRHKPPLDSYTAGIIGLGLLPIAMAFAAILIP
jgi:hypothetical protein